MTEFPIRALCPGLGWAPDYSRAIFGNPPSHDFCTWLIAAEMCRRHHCDPTEHGNGQLRVRLALLDGMLGRFDWECHSIVSTHRMPESGITKEYSERMIANVVRPAIEMIGAVEEPPVEIRAPVRRGLLWNYAEYDYHMAQIVDAGRAGIEVPKWKPPQWAFDEVSKHFGEGQPIVITLRETDRQPERNSDLAEWMRFVAYLGDRYQVVVVRDTAKANETLPCMTWPLASTNTYVRMALYHRALVNLSVVNGPNTWMIFSDAPYLIFKQLIPELPDWAHGQRQGWIDQDHMDIGEQYPWASPVQRLAWSGDSCREIRKAFEEIETLL